MFWNLAPLKALAIHEDTMKDIKNYRPGSLTLLLPPHKKKRRVPYRGSPLNFWFKKMATTIVAYATVTFAK